MIFLPLPKINSMGAVLIASFKNKKDAREAAEYLKGKASVHISENLDALEDLYLGQLIEEGMKEPGSVPVEEVKRELTEMLGGSKAK